MTGLLAFRDRYADEQSCIAALASVRWPDGFVCAGMWRAARLPAERPAAGVRMRRLRPASTR